MKSAIIFGASGQDGYYLNLLLTKAGINVHLVSRNNSPIIGDISNYSFVKSCIKKIAPDYIFHFAAISNVNHKFLFENHKSISNGTLNILESVKIYAPNAKVFLSGSAEQFKNNNLPISEITEFEARSPYSVERIYSTYLARYFRYNHDIKVYVGYFFHHDSPLRNDNHLSKKIINFVKALDINSNKRLIMGDFNMEKEFNFSGDFMEAVWKLVNQNEIFECVIGSGKPYKISKWLELSFNKIGQNWKYWVEKDSSYVSPYKKLYSNPSKIMSLGWRPKKDLYGLFNLMYNS